MVTNNWKNEIVLNYINLHIYTSLGTGNAMEPPMYNLAHYIIITSIYNFT